MAALPNIVEEIVSGVLVVLKHLFTANNSVILRSITQVLSLVRSAAIYSKSFAKTGLAKNQGQLH
jgi:hypothetical protein